MNAMKITSLICGGMISLGGSTLLAQQSSSTTSSQSGSSLGQTSSSELSSSTTGSHWMHSGKNVRLSHLLNSTVQSQDGKTLGTIQDFTVDPQSGHVEFAILSPSATSGYTGSATTSTQPSSRSTTTGAVGSSSYSSATGKLIPIPFQLFSQSFNNSQHSQLGASSTAGTTGAEGMHTLVLNIDHSKLESAPSFDASNWRELQQPNFDQQVYSYYGVNKMSGAGTSGSSISGQGTSNQSGEGARGGSTELQNQNK
jgi:sporulation protein YlmC with PRC-barrel domain